MRAFLLGFSVVVLVGCGGGGGDPPVVASGAAAEPSAAPAPAPASTPAPAASTPAASATPTPAAGATPVPAVAGPDPAAVASSPGPVADPSVASNPPPVLLTASVSQAPAHTANVSGVVRLEVTGTGMANVELLPAVGYAPVFGRFAVSADGTSAVLDWDTRYVVEGFAAYRISAFDRPAGSAGAAEVVAGTRGYTVDNLSQGSTVGFGNVSFCQRYPASC